MKILMWIVTALILFSVIQLITLAITEDQSYWFMATLGIFALFVALLALGKAEYEEKRNAKKTLKENAKVVKQRWPYRECRQTIRLWGDTRDKKSS